MERDRMIFMPNEVVVFLSQEPVFLRPPSEGELDFKLENFDFVQFDATQNRLIKISNGALRSYKERYHFVPTTGGCLYFDVASDFSKLSLVDELIEEAIADLQVDMKDVGISISEIVFNAFQAASDASIKKDIQVSILYVPEDMLSIGISDAQGRLNLDKLPRSFDDEQGDVSLETHGRGLLIVSKLMEWVAYCPSADSSGYKEMLVKVPIKHEPHQ